MVAFENQAQARDQNLDPIRLVVSLLSGSNSTSSGKSSGSCTREDFPTCRLKSRLEIAFKIDYRGRKRICKYLKL